MMKKFYWLKLKNDFFSDKAIKKLRRIAGGDTYTIIYLKMQLFSLANEGKLFYEGLEDAFYKELALDLDEDEDNVRATLIFLENVGLIEKVNDEEYLLNAVPFLIGKESESAERVRRFREKNNVKALQCNANVTGCNENVTIEKEIEIEIEIEKEIEKDKEKREKSDYKNIVAMYNETCVSFPKVSKLSDARRKAIKARLNTYSLEDFKKLFEEAEASDFLKGKNARNWQASFDWLIKDANMVKVLDGNYRNKGVNAFTTKDKQERADNLKAIEDLYME
jgi:predicted phage replisome organizer